MRRAQDGKNSGQLLTHIHCAAKNLNWIHNTVNEPSRCFDLTGCRAQTEREALKMGGVMRTNSKGRRRDCEKVRRLQQLLLLPQRQTASEDLNPSRGCRGCELKAQNFPENETRRG